MKVSLFLAKAHHRTFRRPTSFLGQEKGNQQFSQCILCKSLAGMGGLCVYMFSLHKFYNMSLTQILGFFCQAQGALVLASPFLVSV